MEPPTVLDMQEEYASAAMIAAFKQHLGPWKRDAAAYREAAGARATLDVPYGDKGRERLDIFAPEGGDAGPVALLIHGGYWQTMDKSSFSHLACGANAHGVTVVLAEYTLCPSVTLSAIIDELRQAVAFVAQRFGQPVTVAGHSAGGHLTACMLATDFSAVDPSLGKDTVPAGLAISGVFDLEPLLATNLNNHLYLDEAEARRLSPLFWPAPAGKTLIAYVGAQETASFVGQSRALCERWGAAGVHTRLAAVAGKEHFAVIGELADPESAMTRDLVALTRRR